MIIVTMYHVITPVGSFGVLLLLSARFASDWSLGPRQ